MAARRGFNLAGRFTGRRSASPTSTVGVPGIAIYSGHIQEHEKDKLLATPDARYRTYADILTNVSIVAASIRYYVNLIGGAQWTFKPAEGQESTQYAELAEAMLTDDPDTPWHRVVRRAAMYRFYGFSIQEWTARRREDGYLTFADIAPRAQPTIERWDREPNGKLWGAIQRSPQTSEYLYIPRPKFLYLVDDTLADSPEGLGLFRQMVDPARRLKRYEQLEGFGFETDLRGIPLVRGPLAELKKAAEDPQNPITEDEVKQTLAVLQKFMQNHVRTPDLAILLDSAPYFSSDVTSRPTTHPQWDLELLQGSSTSFAENAAAIERLNRELARMTGTEQLLLGSDVGSYALSKDKTHAFYLLVDGALTEIREAVVKDLIGTLWRLNGWPDELKPEVGTEAVSYQDPAEVAATIRDLATAGAVLDPEDEIIPWFREQYGAPPPTVVSLERQAQLSQQAQGDDGDEDDDQLEDEDE